jgi:hypothetical protein
MRVLLTIILSLDIIESYMNMIKCETFKMDIVAILDIGIYIVGIVFVWKI